MKPATLSFSPISAIPDLASLLLPSLSPRRGTPLLFPFPRKLGFCRPPKPNPNPTSTGIPLSHPSLPSLLHRDDEEDEDDDNDEDEVFAEEYDEVAEVSEEEDDDGFSSASSAAAAGGGAAWFEEPKWKRVDRLRSQVRELGDGIIDVEELASVYDFPIDKFQVFFFSCLIRSNDSRFSAELEREIYVLVAGALCYSSVVSSLRQCSLLRG